MEPEGSLPHSQAPAACPCIAIYYILHSNSPSTFTAVHLLIPQPYLLFSSFGFPVYILSYVIISLNS